MFRLQIAARRGLAIKWNSTLSSANQKRYLASVMSNMVEHDADDVDGDNDKNTDRAWVRQAMQRIHADFQRSADTHLIKLDVPALRHANIDLYLKDESTHPTGSLKHRLARSLFLYGLCNGWITSNTAAIIEASSGSTAISEAYFARLLGLPFVAVVPACTSPSKIQQLEF